MVTKRVDRVISSDAVGLDRKDQTNLRFYVAMEGACTAAGKATPTPHEIAALPMTSVTESTIVLAKERVLHEYEELGSTDQVAKGTELIERLKTNLMTRFPLGVAG